MDQLAINKLLLHFDLHHITIITNTNFLTSEQIFRKSFLYTIFTFLMFICILVNQLLLEHQLLQLNMIVVL